jgi:hypothetical protein
VRWGDGGGVTDRSHSRVGGDLMEIPACAGMTGCGGVTDRSHSRVGGNLMEVPACAGMTGVGSLIGVILA